MAAKRAHLTYAQTGVNIAKGEQVVEHLMKTVSGLGGFGGLFPLALNGMASPVLVSSTDSVGTKLLVADKVRRHDTIGIDCVAMVVNDLIVCGAKPLFFLDYIGIAKLRLRQVKQILAGVAAGCEQAGCPILGGETAELPGVYPDGLYDLVGFGVGIVEKKNILNPESVRPGDKLIGLASSGLHSNGYSLARKIVFDRAKLKPGDRIPELGTTAGKALLEPTRIYVKPILKLLKRHKIRAIANITGGGIPGNLDRALSAKCDAVVDTSTWPRPPIFDWLAKLGPVREKDMYTTLNMGLGMILVVPPKSAPGALRALRRMGEEAYLIGDVRKGNGKVHLK